MQPHLAPAAAPRCPECGSAFVDPSPNGVLCAGAHYFPRDPHTSKLLMPDASPAPALDTPRPTPMQWAVAATVDQQAAQLGSVTDRLVYLARHAEPFHASGTGEPYLTLPVADHRETWALRDPAVRHWLQQRFREAEGTLPRTASLQAALAILEGQARFDGPEHPVWTRVAAQDDTIYLDLADPSWHVVAIRPSGWRLVADASVRFRRVAGQQPLPFPQHGGHLDDLRPFMNVAEAEWRLLVAWLLMALRPRGPYPILVLHGEQGSGKSTTARLLRALVDPFSPPLRRPARSEQDLVLAATHSWLVAFDNLSQVPNWLSDALCALATGSGFGTRALYTDNEERLFTAQRPVLLNGIDDLIARGDLADRTLVITLPKIPPRQRRPEREFWQAFTVAQPRILGALLDAVSHALKAANGLLLDELPRMADFAVWAEAAAPALGWAPGQFLDDYTRHRASTDALQLELSPLVPGLITLAEQGWAGRATDLLVELDRHADSIIRRRAGWPRQPNALSAQLRRLAPHLRTAGVEVVQSRTNKGSWIELRSTDGAVKP